MNKIGRELGTGDRAKIIPQLTETLDFFFRCHGGEMPYSHGVGLAPTKTPLFSSNKVTSRKSKGL